MAITQGPLNYSNKNNHKSQYCSDEWESSKKFLKSYINIKSYEKKIYTPGKCRKPERRVKKVSLRNNLQVIKNMKIYYVRLHLEISFTLKRTNNDLTVIRIATLYLCLRGCLAHPIGLAADQKY